MGQTYTLTNQETGSAINDGDVITVNTSGVTTHVIATNTGNVSLRATLEVLDITNTDGSEMSFCFGFNGGGNCYFLMNEGSTYDSNANNTNFLQPGQSTGTSDIDFTHTENGNHLTYPKDYVLKMTFYNIGSDPNTTTDDTVVGSTTFTYRYDPNTQAVNTFDKNDIVISTAHHHVLIIDSKYVAHVSLYNLTGKKVKEVTLKPSQNHIYTGNLAQGIYILHVTANGKELYKKIILR
jgi:hypothetical protein